MLVRLEVAHQKANVKKVVLKSDTVIGRSADCNLRIASSEISRRHCHLTVNETGVLVRDLGSSNGTFVDGDRIEPNIDVPLNPESELSLGGIRFVVRFKPPQSSQDPGSTVDLPFVASQAAASEDEPSGDDVETTLLDENGPQSGSEPAAPEDATQTPVKIVASNPPGTGADDTLFSSELAEGDTVQTARGTQATSAEPGETELEPPDTVHQFTNAAGEDTIDMRVEDEGLPSVVASEVDSNEVDVPAGDDSASKRWSFFGMFKRKRDAADSAAVPQDDPDSVIADEESTLEEPEVKPFQPDETTIESDAAAASDESPPGVIPAAEAPDEDEDMKVITPGSPADETAAAGPVDDDEALGDFLSNLS